VPWGVDLLFPPVCGVCGRDLEKGEDPLCQRCREDFPRWEERICRVCGVPLPDGGARCDVCRRRRRAFGFCRSAGIYDGGLRTAILQLKYGGREALARPLGLFLAECFYRRPELRRAQVLVPVPLHFVKRQARGFNQAELLALSLAKAVGLPVEARALTRARWTRAQAGLGREERLLNVESAFVVKGPGAFDGRRVLLVDDVCTTGSTLEACARALRSAGALRVDALTLARDVFPISVVRRLVRSEGRVPTVSEARTKLP
jgi:ComF family protein